MLSFVREFQKIYLTLCVFLRMLEIFKGTNVHRTVTMPSVVIVTPVGQFRPDSVTVVWGNNVRAGKMRVIDWTVELCFASE